MIKKLTDAQVAKFPEYVDKWLRIGLSCEPCDEASARAALVDVYREGGLEPPKLVIVTDCPITCAIAGAMLSQVGSQVLSQVESQVYGSHDASWLAFYDFFRRGCGLDAPKRLDGLMRLAQACGWWLPLNGAAIIQHRHEEVHLRNGVLHRDGGPAIRYRGNVTQVWVLNGVRVPQWLAEERAEAIDARRLTKIDNAQVRAEFVRKVGVDRVCHAMNAACVDKQGNYELLLLDLGDGRRRPYLKMLNPSVPELWHVEGVHPDCNTVTKALNWRNGTTLKPSVLT